MADIDLRTLVKQFPKGTRALNGIDLTIHDGEFFALLGPSGCGKTTLLRSIAGLEQVTSGSIEIAETNVTRLRPGARNVAMVFQDYALFPHMTVTQNIAYPLRISGVHRSDRDEQAVSIGKELSLGKLMDRRPAELSGGQQQRVALARAIATHPQVFLFDEPLSNLDARLRLEARSFLRRLQQQLKVTTVFVTHDQAEALAISDRMAVMDGGNIRQVGTPRELFQYPANTFVANFIGSTPMNLLPARVRQDSLELAGHLLPIPRRYINSVADGETVTYGVRPEYLEYSPDPVEDAIYGRVMSVENLGVNVLLSLDTSGAELGVVVPEDENPGIGSHGWVRAKRRDPLLYRAETGDLIDAESTVSQG